MSGPASEAESPISFACSAFQKERRFAAYDRLRDEAPVYRDPLTGHYIITRYADVRAVLLNIAVFSNDAGMVGLRESAQRQQVEAIYLAEGALPGRNLQTYDPPEHKLHRAPVDRAFDHWNVLALHDEIRSVSNHYIDAFADQGQCEFVSAFAIQLPLHIFADQLGLPVADSGKLKLWADTAVEEINPVLTPEREIEIAHILAGMYTYFKVTLQRVRQDPDDRLVSKIAQARDVHGELLDMPEMLEVMRAIVVAAGDTTTLAFGGGMRLLIENPDTAVRLRDYPQEIDGFVEEVLRIVSPVQTLFRRVKRDVDLHGVTIPRGALVEARYGAANLDAARFGCPRQLDPTRENAKSHLAFGIGVHACLGMVLARTELKIGFEALLARLEKFRFAAPTDSCEDTASYIANGPIRLEMSFDRRGR